MYSNKQLETLEYTILYNFEIQILYWIWQLNSRCFAALSNANFSPECKSHFH